MPHIRISTNQTTWTTATFAGGTATGNFISFVNTNNVWGALTSTGQVWRNSQNTASLGSFSLSPSYPTGLTQLSHFNGVFVGIAEGNVQFSNDLIDWYGGLQWTTVTSPVSGYTIGRVVYGNGIWIAMPTIGSFASGAFPGTQFMGLSTNGTTWTTVQSHAAIHGSFAAFAYGNGRWVSGTLANPAQGGGWMTSTNGTTWTTVTPLGTYTQCWSIAYGNGKWMSGGWDPATATSTDGIAWVTDTSPGMSNYTHLVKYVNNLWFAATSNETKTSTNGTTWTTIFNTAGSNVPFPLDFDYGHNRWVGVGGLGYITTSTNGTTWTTIASPAGSPNGFGNVVYGNGVWIASGSSSRGFTSEGNMSRVHITSTNGTTWTTVRSIGRSNLSFGNGVWVAAYNKFFVSTNPTGQSNCNKFIKSQDEQRGAFLSNSGVLFNWNGQETFNTISTGDRKSVV